MPAKHRDEFPAAIRRVIAECAAYTCAKCKHLTIRPHSDPEKSLNSGVAAHIRAASPNGPRYDPNQTPEQRKSPHNGIWLCHTCSDIVDADKARYPAPLLDEMRADHQRWVAAEGMVAKLPEILVSTLDGLTIPLTGGTITGEHVATFREHHLVIRNVGHHRIERFAGRIQLPEPAKPMRVDAPPGVAVDVRPNRMEFVANVQGGGAVQIPNVADHPCPNFKVAVDQLVPGHKIRIVFYSIPDPHPRSQRDLDIFAGSLWHYVDGSYLYERNESFASRTFLVALRFDPATRKLASDPCEEDMGTRSRVESMIGF